MNIKSERSKKKNKQNSSYDINIDYTPLWQLFLNLVLHVANE